MKYLLILIGCLSFTLLNGQSIGSYVITSAGDAIMSDGGAFYLAIGEPMNTELHGGEIMISQGFLQVSIADRILSNDEILDEQITVYPNPTIQELRFKLEDVAASYACMIYDSSGQVLEQIFSLKDSGVNVSQYPSGTYFVTLHKDGKVSGTIQFVKL